MFEPRSIFFIGGRIRIMPKVTIHSSEKMKLHGSEATETLAYKLFLSEAE
jgi:hypothetical protein